MGVCLERGPCIRSFGFQRKKDFLFSVKTPCVGLVCSLSVVPPSSLGWPKVFPQGLYLWYPRWLAALGICAIPVIASSRLSFGLNFAISIVNTCDSPICPHVNIAESWLLSFSSKQSPHSFIGSNSCWKIKILSVIVLFIINSSLCLPIAE